MFEPGQDPEGPFNKKGWAKARIERKDFDPMHPFGRRTGRSVNDRLECHVVAACPLWDSHLQEAGSMHWVLSLGE
jgi:hypothetical protein